VLEDNGRHRFIGERERARTLPSKKKKEWDFQKIALTREGLFLQKHVETVCFLTGYDVTDDSKELVFVLSVPSGARGLCQSGGTGKVLVWYNAKPCWSLKLQFSKQLVRVQKTATKKLHEDIHFTHAIHLSVEGTLE
jgi:hypothetical protein